MSFCCRCCHLLPLWLFISDAKCINRHSKYSMERVSLWTTWMSKSFSCCWTPSLFWFVLGKIYEAGPFIAKNQEVFLAFSSESRVNSEWLRTTIHFWMDETRMPSDCFDSLPSSLCLYTQHCHHSSSSPNREKIPWLRQGEDVLTQSHLCFHSDLAHREIWSSWSLT